MLVASTARIGSWVLTVLLVTTVVTLPPHPPIAHFTIAPEVIQYTLLVSTAR